MAGARDTFPGEGGSGLLRAFRNVFRMAPGRGLGLPGEGGAPRISFTGLGSHLGAPFERPS